MYTSKSSCKFYLKAHLIFVVKYRHKILKDKFKDTLIITMNNISLKYDFKIDMINSDIDHSHLLISYPPQLAISQIVRVLKQETTISLWKLFKNYLLNYFWKENTLFSDGYFVSSIGEVSASVIKNYIENQGK